MTEREQSSAIPPITGSLTVQQHLQVGGAPNDTTQPTDLLSVRGNFSHQLGLVNIEAGEHIITSTDGSAMFKGLPDELLVYVKSEFNGNLILAVTKTSDTTLTLERPHAITSSDFDIPLFINPPTLFSITNGAPGKNAAEYLSVDSRGNVHIGGTLTGVSASDVSAIHNTAGAVQSSNLHDGAVTTAKIANLNVTESKLEQAVQDKLNKKWKATDVGAIPTTAGAVQSSSLHDGAVTAAKIKDGEVGTNELAKDAVTTPKIKNGAVDMKCLAKDVKTALDGRIKRTAINFTFETGDAKTFNSKQGMTFLQWFPKDFEPSKKDIWVTQYDRNDQQTTRLYFTKSSPLYYGDEIQLYEVGKDNIGEIRVAFKVQLFDMFKREKVAEVFVLIHFGEKGKYGIRIAFDKDHQFLADADSRWLGGFSIIQVLGELEEIDLGEFGD
ncbi:MAG: hypothetical protein AAF702_23540 [Chloroflexota bacterium]